MTNYIPAGDIGTLLPYVDSSEFSADIYRRAGLFVLRRAIPDAVIRRWQAEWSAFYTSELAGDRRIDPYAPVVVHEAAPPALRDIYRSPYLLNVLERLYPDLGLYMQRFAIKDRKSRGAVFLHHDVCYDLGWPEKTSAFVALSIANRENGGLILYPATHALGYLGDVGELNRALLDPEWPAICPAVEPGDVILMHECTWHASEPHIRGPDRVLVQITYQPASDPTSAELLRGEWRTRYRLAAVSDARFFTRSRASRLRELQAEVDRLKAATPGA